MEEILSKLPNWVEFASVIVASIVLGATVIVRLTPSYKDDEIVNGFAKVFFKILAYLPTLGINPQTKELKKAYEDLKKVNDVPTDLS